MSVIGLAGRAADSRIVKGWKSKGTAIRPG